MARHMCFQQGLLVFSDTSALGSCKPVGFKVSLQVSHWQMPSIQSYFLAWGGGIHFRLCWLALDASLSLLPGSRLQHGKAYYPWLLCPPPPSSLYLSLSPSFPSLPPSLPSSLSSDKTGPDKTTGKVWVVLATGPSQPKQLEAQG